PTSNPGSACPTVDVTGSFFLAWIAPTRPPNAAPATADTRNRIGHLNSTSISAGWKPVADARIVAGPTPADRSVTVEPPPLTATRLLSSPPRFELTATMTESRIDEPRVPITSVAVSTPSP